MRNAFIYALVLAVATGVAGTAYAASTTRTHVFSDVSNAQQAYYLDFLGSLGIFRGDAGPGGPARPNDTITRAEYAVVVVRMLGRESLARMMAGFTPPFGDAASIPSWAIGAVNLLYNMNVLRGDEAGNFRPNDPVKGAEALAMLTRALGNDGGVTGVWPMNYMMWAYDTGLLPHDVDLASWKFIAANIPITRAQMALLTCSALFAWRNYDPEDMEYNLPPLARAFYGTGRIVWGYDLAESEIAFGVYSTYALAPVVTLYGGSSMEAFLFRVVNYAVNKDDEIVWLETATGDVLAGIFDDWHHDLKTDKWFIVLEDAKQIQFEPGFVGTTYFRVNGGPLLTYLGTHGSGVEEIMQEGDLLTIILDDDGVATYVNVFQQEGCSYIAAKPVADNDPDDDIIGTIDVLGDFAREDLEVTGDTLITGDTDSFAGLREEDIVYVALIGGAGDTAFAIEVIRETRVGVIEDIAVSYPGGVHFIEFQTGPDLELAGEDADGYWGDDPAGGIDEEWTFKLDREGLGRLGTRTAGAVPVYPLVKITGYQDRAKDRVLAQDYTGAFFTFSVAGDSGVEIDPSDVGRVCELELAGRARAEASRTDDIEIGDVVGVTWFHEDYEEAAWPYKIYAIDTKAGQMTLGDMWDDGEWLFVDNDEVLVFDYDYDGGWWGDGCVGDYVGLDGLKVGDYVLLVLFDPDGSAETDWYLVVRFWDEDGNGEVYDNVLDECPE